MRNVHAITRANLVLSLSLLFRISYDAWNVLRECANIV